MVFSAQKIVYKARIITFWWNRTWFSNEMTQICAMQTPIAYDSGESPNTSDTLLHWQLQIWCELQWVAEVGWSGAKGVCAWRVRSWLTNLSRKVFSLSAPMQPAKPKMNMTPPTTMKSHTGSKPPRSVIDDRLDSTPWGKGRKRVVTILTVILPKINPSSITRSQYTLSPYKNTANLEASLWCQTEIVKI